MSAQHKREEFLPKLSWRSRCSTLTDPNTMRSRPSCCRINALCLARAQPHSSLLRFPPSVRVACAGRLKDRCCVLLCVDQLGVFSFYYFIFCILCSRVCETETGGDSPAVEGGGGAGDDFKGESGQHEDASPSVWPCKFHDKYLAIKLAHYQSGCLKVLSVCIQTSVGVF